MKLSSSCRESLQIAILLLLLSSVTVLCQKTVIGIEGQPITLPCSYKVQKSSDITHMCWGRGSCPSSKCNQELIWTDGHKVTHQSSSRYQLNDKISQGIVSLTITQASLEDAGTYCCRIEHKGWFNDEKINIKLTVEKAPTTTVRTTTRTTVRTTTPAPTTMKTTQAPPTVKTSTPQLVQTTQEPIDVWTNPLTTSMELSTQTPISDTKSTSTTPLPPVIQTETPPSSIARTTTPSPNVFPADMTERTDLTPRSSGIPGFIPNHEMTTSDESKADDKEPTTHSPWPGSLSPNNDGIANLFQGNDTAPVTKDRNIIIIAITLTVIVLIVICVILLQLKGHKRGSQLFGMDPRLELVTHAEEPMTDLQTKDPKTAEEHKAETNHIENTTYETKD